MRSEGFDDRDLGGHHRARALIEAGLTPETARLWAHLDADELRPVHGRRAEAWLRSGMTLDDAAAVIRAEEDAFVQECTQHDIAPREAQKWIAICGDMESAFQWRDAMRSEGFGDRDLDGHHRARALIKAGLTPETARVWAHLDADELRPFHGRITEDWLQSGMTLDDAAAEATAIANRGRDVNRSLGNVRSSDRLLICRKCRRWLRSDEVCRCH